MRRPLLCSSFAVLAAACCYGAIDIYVHGPKIATVAVNSGATILTDSFTGTDATALESHTGEIGATWTKHTSYSTGSSAITSNRIRSANANTSCYYASGTPPDSSYSVTAIIRCVSTLLSTNGTGVAARINTAANTMYFVRVSSAAGGTWTMNELVAGSNTTIGASFVSPVVLSQDYTVKLVVTDAVKQFWIDGVMKGSSTANNITAAGFAGVRHVDQSGVGMHIDSISAVDE